MSCPEKCGIELRTTEDGFTLSCQGNILLQHSGTNPTLSIGRGNGQFEMDRGNFEINDQLEDKLALTSFEIQEEKEGWKIVFSRGNVASSELQIRSDKDGRMVLELKNSPSFFNRIWLRLAALPDQHVYGCGEQFSYFDLRGKSFPLWTREQGVGRNKKTYATWLADVNSNAGGDYHTTYFPQPTFVCGDSSPTQKYLCHVENTCYMNFDFSDPQQHELSIWQDEARIVFDSADNWVSLVSQLTALLGRQPELPDWVHDGVILGVQGGTDVCQEKLQRMQQVGVKVSGIWAQDWAGQRTTSFGKRLMWNWCWDEKQYPKLPEAIRGWKKEGVRFLAYVNPYLVTKKKLYAEATKRDYLVKDGNNADYQVDFGEFHCGMVDLTNKAAFQWFKETVIKKNMLQLGIHGWMADFGEYLPTDAVLHNGVSAELMHNAWPVLFAKCNHQAVQESGKLGEALFFTRAGHTGSQKHSLMMWAGGQNVEWSLDDGLASVIPAALSLGMSGHGLHHSDIGGYTSFMQMKRSKELLLRWCDFATFTPMMRTHESNRPDCNWQFDSDEETIRHFARMTDIFKRLKPYIKNAVKENAEKGIPVMRPLFMHYPDDAATYKLKYQYLLGRDLLVAPVYRLNALWSPIRDQLKFAL